MSLTIVQKSPVDSITYLNGAGRALGTAFSRRGPAPFFGEYGGKCWGDRIAALDSPHFYRRIGSD
jgi:hypothetical protein